MYMAKKIILILRMLRNPQEECMSCGQWHDMRDIGDISAKPFKFKGTLAELHKISKHKFWNLIKT